MSILEFAEGVSAVVSVVSFFVVLGATKKVAKIWYIVGLVSSIACGLLMATQIGFFGILAGLAFASIVHALYWGIHERNTD